MRAIDVVHSRLFKDASLRLPPRFHSAYLVYKSALAITSLVKIALIFLPLIAHSVQQIAVGGLHGEMGALITPRARSTSGESLALRSG